MVDDEVAGLSERARAWLEEIGGVGVVGAHEAVVTLDGAFLPSAVGVAVVAEGAKGASILSAWRNSETLEVAGGDMVAGGRGLVVNHVFGVWLRGGLAGVGPWGRFSGSACG